jgi:hypothetical protein
MQALHVLCPAGPIIASALWVDAPADGSRAGRAARLGLRIGRGLAWLRGMPPADSTHLTYRARRGYAYTYCRAELESLAGGIGRRVAWEAHAGRPTPYFTLVAGEASA